MQRANFWTCLVEERMAGHVKDVHLDFSVTNLHSENIRTHTIKHSLQ